MSTIAGLPAHILLVHAVVVLVPLTAVLTVLVAVWPAARARLALPNAVLAVATLVMVPLTTDAGEWLEHHVARTPLVRIHTQLGDTLLPWMIGLAVVAVAVFARQWLGARSVTRGRVPVGAGAPAAPEPAEAPTAVLGGRAVTVTVALAVLAVAVAVGSVVTVYRIGDSGARASWTGQFSEQTTTQGRALGG